MKMGFKSFIKTSHKKKRFSGPMEDFVSDAAADSQFKDFKTWPELLNYLHDCSACDGALKAGRDVWLVWEFYRG